MKCLKWLLNSWWGRLFILVQTACLIITIYLAINFIINSRQEEDSDIAATLHAEDVSRDFGETIQTPDLEHPFEKEIDRIKKETQRRKVKNTNLLLAD